MTDTLVTADAATLARVLVMEPLAVPAAATASKRWFDPSQNPPWWGNRPGTFGPATGSESLPSYTRVIHMRLYLGFAQEATRTDDIDGNVQEKAWEYQAAVMRYFEKYRMLKPPGYAELTHISPDGCSINGPIGLALTQFPTSTSVYLTLDFELTVPYLIGTEEA